MPSRVHGIDSSAQAPADVRAQSPVCVGVQEPVEVQEPAEAPRDEVPAQSIELEPQPPWREQ
eukprot:1094116-Lingulodinium_polyedra.AAC.1